MDTPESSHSAEAVQQQPDLLIVLGKNIGVDSTPEDIRNNLFNLSTDSRLSVIAAGELYQPGMHILFSTGKTAGEDTPSESSAMRDYLHRLFPGIPAEAVFLEEDSIDTAGNAEKVAEWLQGKKYGRKALVSVGYHADNAATLFENYGVPIEKTYASEEVVRERSNHHAAYVMGWQGLKRVRSEYRKELVRKALLHTVDPRGKLLRRVTERSRK